MRKKIKALRVLPISIVLALLASCEQLYVPVSSPEPAIPVEQSAIEEPTAMEIEGVIGDEIVEAIESLREEGMAEVIAEEPAELMPVAPAQNNLEAEPVQIIDDEIVEEIVAEIVEIIEEPEAIESWRLAEETESQKQSVRSFCEEVGKKLGSVDVSECLVQDLRFAGTYTKHNRPIAVRDYEPTGSLEGKTRILIMGGIHGDEYSSISIVFKWMSLMNEAPSSDFLWRFAPSVNPDGLLGGTAIRQNGNGVDLNRNFPSRDWDEDAQKYWQGATGSNPRRYPGEYAASEREVQWIVNQIETFKPDVIMSVHAPYHLLDFDGPSQAPDRIGELYLHVLGVYPGSLGNYAGIDLEIPVVTLELPAAGIMPSEEQITNMWVDIQSWLHERVSDEG